MPQMTRREFLAGVGAALAATGITKSSWAQGGAAAPGARKPNIIYYLADELGYYELACLGHPDFKTPNFDKLAAEGMRFRNYMAGSAVCAPVRCTLLTGKHSGHGSVRDNGTHQTLQEGEPTLGSMLKAAGYATGGFGKWGEGNRGSAGVPEKHGFDVFYGYYDQSHAHSYYPPYLVHNSREAPLAGNKAGLNLEGGTYAHYEIVAQTKQWIRENKDRPFFAYLCWTPPHGSYAIPESDPSWELYKDKPWPRDAKVYAAMVNMIDRHFGEVMDLVKELGLDDNTVVMFSGDNGGSGVFKSAEKPHGFFSPNVDPKTGRVFRGFKGSIYEGGIRTTLLARWPGRIKPGQVTEHLCAMYDTMPTMAEIAGAGCPQATDGISFLPTLTGEGVQKQHEFLYWEFKAMTAVRLGNWKGVQPRKEAAWELYDLSADIEEKNNVAAGHPEIVEKIKAIAQREHTAQPTAGVFDVELNARDLQSVYPGKGAMGVAAGGEPGAGGKKAQAGRKAKGAKKTSKKL